MPCPEMPRISLADAKAWHDAGAALSVGPFPEATRTSTQMCTDGSRLDWVSIRC